MKMRNGFVSNSSTSSFCLVGFAMDPDKADEMGLYEKFTVLSGSEDGVPDNETVVGSYLFDCEDDGCFTLTELDSDIEKIKILWEEVGQPAPIKIYYGTRMC